jgi:hypothetical protein
VGTEPRSATVRPTRSGFAPASRSAFAAERLVGFAGRRISPSWLEIDLAAAVPALHITPLPGATARPAPSCSTTARR